MPVRTRLNIPSEIVRTVVAIDALGSFSKAGKALGLSQPAISAQVKRLNAIVGGSVFDNRGGVWTVTPLGQLVLAQAKRFISANDQILALGGSTERDRPLRLGIPNLYAKEFLKAWQPVHGEPDISITAAYSSAILESFRGGFLDVACLLGPPADLGTPILHWQEKLVWLRGRDFVLPPGKAIPVIALPGSVSDQPMFAALEKASLNYRVTFTSADPGARFAALNAGYGIAVSPERFVPDNFVTVTENYLPKLAPLRVGIFVSADFDAELCVTLVQTLRRLAPPEAEAASS